MNRSERTPVLQQIIPDLTNISLTANGEIAPLVTDQTLIETIVLPTIAVQSVIDITSSENVLSTAVNEVA